MTTSTAPVPARRPSPVPAALGFGAGLLAVALLGFSVVGALWGWWRPAQTGQVTDDAQVVINDLESVEFTSYASFSLLTALLGLLLGLWVFFRSPQWRGPWTLLWLGLVCVLGSLAFWQVGDVSAILFNPVPDFDSIAPGAEVSVVPAIAPGVSLAVSPLLGMLAYWCATLVSPEQR